MLSVITTEQTASGLRLDLDAIVRQSVDVGPVTRGLRPGLVKRMWPLPSVSTDQPRLAASLARSRCWPRLLRQLSSSRLLASGSGGARRT